MNKNLCILIGLGAMLASAAAYSWDDHDSKQSWSLPKDVLGTSNQISFNQGANGVWYFMESYSLTHDPLQYRFLPDYTAPCSYGVLGVAVGAACWSNASDAFHISNFEQPKVIINPSDQQIAFQTQLYPPRTLAQSPRPFSLSVVAWRSPVNARVSVLVSFTTLETCANGVTWSIDKGNNEC